MAPPELFAIQGAEANSLQNIQRRNWNGHHEDAAAQTAMALKLGPTTVSRPTTDPRDSAPDLDRYPANSFDSPGHHRPPPPVTATSHCYLRHPLAITAVTATSAPVLAIMLPIAATSAPALATPVTPSPCRDPHHASQSCITTDLTFARHTPLLLPPHHPTTVCLCISSMKPPRRVTCLNLTPPCIAPGSHPKPWCHDPPLEPKPEPRGLPTA
ncbi:hypothetical protein C0993_009835 [Termitomyces sp. T159_Od127]|nr:hypothetical protein C0993_009835 [Termitomyces sp. T159_Od127]